jgi:pyruvate-formate lyase
MPKVKFYGAKALVYTGGVVAITAVVVVGSAVLARIDGRKWL